MKEVRAIIFLVLMTAMLLACGGSYDKRLVDIDSLTLVEPLKAISLLDSMSSDGLSQADRMYFELLRIKARDKAYIVHQTDSGLQDILEYFELHDSSKLAEAYYYAGSVYRDLCDALQAVEFFQKTIETLPKDDCSKMKSNAYFQCGNLYRLQYLNEQAVNMIRESYNCDSIAGDTLRMADCLMQIGNIIGHDFYNNEVKDSVLRYYNEAYDMACKINDEKIKTRACVNLAFFYINIGDDGKAQPYLLAIADYLEKNPADYLRFQYAELMAKQMMKQENYDAALPYCREMLGSNSIYHRKAANENLHLIYSEKHDFIKAKHFLSEYQSVEDSVKILTASENTAHASALYNYQLRERDNLTLKAENQKRLYTIFILGAAFLLLFFVSLLYRMKHRQEKQTLSQQVARLSQLERMQREQNESLIAENNQRMDELEIARLSAQVTIARQDLTRKKLFESEAYEMLKQRIAKCRPLRSVDIALLDDTVNHICDGFKSTLYSAYNLSLQEYVVCLLLKFELSATDISCLLSRTTSAITQTRKRLYTKLFGQKGSASDLDDYIRNL